MSYEENHYDFDDMESLKNVVGSIKNRYEARKAEDGDVLCKFEDDGNEVWRKDHKRKPLVVFDNGSAVTASAVSDKTRFYTPIQFHEPLEFLVEGLAEKNESDFAGRITIGQYCKRMYGEISFPDKEISDPTSNGKGHLMMRVSAGHNGFSAVRCDVGMYRVVCSNGMVAFDSDFTMKQTHSEGTLSPSVILTPLDALENPDRVKSKLVEGHKRRFNSREEVILFLADIIPNHPFDDILDALRHAFNKEVEYSDNSEQMRTEPSLTDAYNVATHAIEHCSTDECTRKQKEIARNQARKVIENYEGDLQNPNQKIEETVNRRTEALTENEEENFDGEEELIRAVVSN